MAAKGRCLPVVRRYANKDIAGVRAFSPRWGRLVELIGIEPRMHCMHL